MTPEQIEELFIQAALVDRKLPIHVGHKTLKAMNIGITHTFADMVHWPDEEKHEIRWAWLDPESLRASRNDVGIWELAMEIMKLVPNERNRRALWAWAKAKGDDHAFARWCRKEINGKTKKAISPQLGNYRRSAAIECILRAFERKALQNNDNGETEENEGFTNEAQKEHKQDTIEVWRSDDAKPLALDFDRELQDFSWAEAQNERRRQREANARRKQAA